MSGLRYHRHTDDKADCTLRRRLLRALSIVLVCVGIAFGLTACVEEEQQRSEVAPPPEFVSEKETDIPESPPVSEIVSPEPTAPANATAPAAQTLDTDVAEEPRQTEDAAETTKPESAETVDAGDGADDAGEGSVADTFVDPPEIPAPEKLRRSWHALIGQAPEPPAGRVLRIGVMGPFTGPNAARGLAMARGARVAATLLEQRGLLPGYDAVWLHLKDSGCKAYQGVSAVNGMMADKYGPVVAVLGGFCGETVLAASEILHTMDSVRQVVMLTPWATHPRVTGRNLPLIFRLAARDEEVCRTAAAFARLQLQAKTIGVVQDGEELTAHLAPALAEAAAGAGLGVAGPWTLGSGSSGETGADTGDEQATMAVAKAVASSGVDAVFLAMRDGARTAAVVRALREAGWYGGVIGHHVFYATDFLEAVGVDQRVFGIAPVVDRAGPAYHLFAAAADRMGFDVARPEAAASFDAAYALALACTGNAESNATTVGKVLRSISFSGITGPVSFGPEGDSPPRPLVVQRIADDGVVDFWRPDRAKPVPPQSEEPEPDAATDG